MPHAKYLIVGGGMTADSVQGIRKADATGTIAIIVSLLILRDDTLDMLGLSPA